MAAIRKKNSERKNIVSTQSYRILKSRKYTIFYLKSLKITYRNNINTVYLKYKTSSLPALSDIYTNKYFHT